MNQNDDRDATLPIEKRLDSPGDGPPREEFQAPNVTEANIDSFLALDKFQTPGLPKGFAENIKRQAAKAMIQGTEQAARKRCFMAFIAFFAHRNGQMNKTMLLEFMNEFEYGLLSGVFGKKANDMLNAIEVQAKVEAIEELDAVPALPEKPEED